MAKIGFLLGHVAIAFNIKGSRKTDEFFNFLFFNSVGFIDRLFLHLHGGQHDKPPLGLASVIKGIFCSDEKDRNFSSSYLLKRAL